MKIFEVPFHHFGMEWKAKFDRSVDDGHLLGLFRGERLQSFKGHLFGQAHYHQGVVQTVLHIVEEKIVLVYLDAGFFQEFPLRPFLPGFTPVDIAAGEGESPFAGLDISPDDHHTIGHRQQHYGHRQGIPVGGVAAAQASPRPWRVFIEPVAAEGAV